MEEHYDFYHDNLTSSFTSLDAYLTSDPTYYAKSKH